MGVLEAAVREPRVGALAVGVTQGAPRTAPSGVVAETGRRVPRAGGPDFGGELGSLINARVGMIRHAKAPYLRHE